MPTFCRHNRLVQNCTICAREQSVELRPVVSPAGRPEPRPRPASGREGSGSASGARPAAARSRGGGRGSGAVTVRRLARDAGDGYASDLVPGIHSVADAERLADELVFAEARLRLLTAAPPGLYADLADPAGELEERLWLAVQIAILGPLDTAEEDPFAAIAGARTSWASGDSPALPAGSLGPRAGDPAHAPRAFAAYRAWAQRLGGQATALAGESSWTPARRFDRTFERLGTLSLARAARYDLLASLGRTGVIALAGERLHVGGSDPVTIAAKRVFGIGDPLLIERRAAELAGASGLPLEAFDLGLCNWERRARYGAGADPALPLDAGLLGATRAALGLE